VIPGIGDSQFPTWLTNIGASSVPGTQLSWSLLIFIILAVVFGVVLVRASATLRPAPPPPGPLL
jgi:hypothetical protein